jgi:hypothetical protein
MSRVVSFVRRHGPAVLLALAVGITSALSVFLVRGFPPIISTESLDSAWYHAVLNETIMGGEPWNAVLAEPLRWSPPVPVLAERVMAFPARLFGMTAHDALTMWRVLLPALLALSIYATSIVITRSRGFSLAASGAIPMLAPFVIAPIFSLSVLVGKKTPLLYTVYDRPVHPQFEAWLLILFMFGMVLALGRTGRRWFAVGSGLILGLLTYSYFWAWTWGYAFLGVLLLVSFLERKRSSVLTVLTAWGVALLIGSMEIIQLVRHAFGGGDAAYLERLGLDYGHVFADATLNFPIVVGLALLIASRKYLTTSIVRFAGAGLAATFIAVNQQLVTGRSFQPDHYLSLIGGALLVWVVAWFVWARIANRGFRARIVSAALMLLVAFLFQLGMQARIAQAAAPIARGLVPLQEVIDWLETHGEPRSAIFVDQRIGMALPALSRMKLWWHFYAMAVPTDDERNRNAAFIWFALAGLDAASLKQEAVAHPIEVSQYFTLTTSYEARLQFLAEHIEGIATEYETFIKDTDLGALLRRYHGDYVLSDRGLDLWDPKRFGPLEEVFRNERFTLYRVLPRVPGNPSFTEVF